MQSTGKTARNSLLPRCAATSVPPAKSPPELGPILPPNPGGTSRRRRQRHAPNLQRTPVQGSLLSAPSPSSPSKWVKTSTSARYSKGDPPLHEEPLLGWVHGHHANSAALAPFHYLSTAWNMSSDTARNAY